MSLDATSLLVTGGAGFVGNCVVRTLLERCPKARIVVLDNLFNGKRSYLPQSDQLHLAQCDLTNAADVMRVVAESRPEVVIHLAALHYIPYCNQHPAETLQVNVVGTQHLLEACRQHQPQKIVIASSAAVYPIRDVANREDSATGPTDIYGLTKWINESQLQLFAEQVEGTHCAAARMFNVIGPRETNPHVLPEIVRQVLAGETSIQLGNVKPKRDYVFVSDVANALITIAFGNEHSYRVFNVGTGEEYSVEELVALIRRISGRTIEIKVAQDRVRKQERMHLLCDRTRIEQELNWRPQFNVESGLAALWRFETEGSGSACSQALRRGVQDK
ncbi:MAG: GDP-mannose 4,6-dehydratase [Planctomycetes bacterium]|nr:GDP-mannose 4,6-dehydratase [Planctomycetota bacterium]